MKGLTKRQSEIVAYIHEFIATNRYSPSYREIANYFGFSSLGSVQKHINALINKGILSNQSKSSRSLSPNLPSSQILNHVAIEIPFLGTLSAGTPIHTFPQAQKISIPRFLVHSPEKTYALRAQGNSLNEEMIVDGDLILVEARQQANPGETIVALINGQDTLVKKYYIDGDYIRLISAHSHFHPIVLRPENILIQGIVIGLLRNF